MAKTIALLLMLVLFAGVSAACGGGDQGSESKKAQQRVLGGLTFADHGTKNAARQTELEVEVDDYYFQPTFVQGEPGQKLTLRLKNDSTTVHNLSIQAQRIDRDIPVKGKLDVEVTIPQSGAVLFFCKYHTATNGMNGEFLAGNATPQPVGSPTPGDAGGAGRYDY